jgi:hypothetical protein
VIVMLIVIRPSKGEVRLLLGDVVMLWSGSRPEQIAGIRSPRSRTRLSAHGLIEHRVPPQVLLRPTIRKWP